MLMTVVRQIDEQDLHLFLSIATQAFGHIHRIAVNAPEYSQIRPATQTTFQTPSGQLYPRKEIQSKQTKYKYGAHQYGTKMNDRENRHIHARMMTMRLDFDQIGM